MTTHFDPCLFDEKANVIAQELLVFLNGKPHAQSIYALIELATVMAARHPCCTEKAVKSFYLCAEALEVRMQQNPLMYTPTNPTTH